MRGAKLWFTRPGIRQMYIGVRIKPHLILSLKVENILKYDSMATFQTNADYYKAAPNFEPTQPNPHGKGWAGYQKSGLRR